MRREIERKFLVAEIPLRGTSGVRIMQGYLAVDGDGTEVRLRAKGERRFLTVKKGAGLERLEAETEVTARQFETLWPLTEGRRLTKVRYEVEHGDRIIEVDLYEGGLAGLVTAEVEFESRAQGEEFVPPSWVGEEVTGDGRYLNRSLALGGVVP